MLVENVVWGVFFTHRIFGCDTCMRIKLPGCGDVIIFVCICIGCYVNRQKIVMDGQNIVTSERLLLTAGCGDGPGDHCGAAKQQLLLSNGWSLKPSDPHCLACPGQLKNMLQDTTLR